MSIIYERAAKKMNLSVSEVIRQLDENAEKISRESIASNLCISFLRNQRRTKLSPSFEVCLSKGEVTRKVHYLTPTKHKFRFCGPCDRAQRALSRDFKMAIAEVEKRKRKRKK